MSDTREMKIAPVKYMRDFYPEEMALREWIEEHWRQASLAAGFRAWDGPILEHLDLYTRKSGEEIVGQLYTLADRGGRELAVRPEMTPSLARMVAQRQASLGRPIKWFCIARLCRYERGQRGRLREHWQWNADVLGVAEPIADAEVISVGLDGLALLGLGPEEVEVRINSRGLMASLLAALGLAPDSHGPIYAVTDKRGKVPPDVLHRMYEELGLAPALLDRLEDLLASCSLEELDHKARAHGLVGYEPELEHLHRLFEILESLGKGPYCRFDPGIVRGLAYYTGTVFEMFDRAGQLRAICGGGRYDHLLELMGGEPMPAVGFGMGDVVLGELLKERGKLPPPAAGVDYHLVALEEERLLDAVRLAGQLREQGVRADYAMKAGGLGRAMKRAAESAARYVIFVGGREWQAGRIRLRNMQTGEEEEIPSDRLQEWVGQAPSR